MALPRRCTKWKPCSSTRSIVVRLDPKFDCKTQVLHINGFWLEEDAPVDDPAFADALGKGLARFANFVEVERVDIESINLKKLQKHIRKYITL